MVRLVNDSPTKFIEYTKGKEVYLWGAGKLAENCIELYFHNREVKGIVDNNKSLWGTQKVVNHKSINIISLEDFITEFQHKSNDIVLLVTPTLSSADIIEQLDNVTGLTGLTCFIHGLIRNTWDGELGQFEFTDGKQRIPKVIHYFWVGGNPIPHELQHCIDSWKRANPEYEIKRWDESNYDFSWCPYMKEAYDNKAWGFVPDVARLDVIYRYGGIYLDTDVEAIKSFDKLLNDNAFFPMSCLDRIGIGAGFGAMPDQPIIKEMIDFYDGIHFVNSDGSFNRTACYYYQYPILKKYGFKVNGCYQKINDVVVYPPEVFSPEGSGGLGNFYSKNTVSIHHGSGTWVTEHERDNANALKKLLGRAESI